MYPNIKNITSACNECVSINQNITFFCIKSLRPKGYSTFTAHLSIKCLPATGGTGHHMEQNSSLS